MTGWHISIGYLSGYSTSLNRDEAWVELKREAVHIAQTPAMLAQEAYEFGAPKVDDVDGSYRLADYCTIYSVKPENGCPLSIDDDRQEVMITASGNRTMKEHVARAFVRLLMAAMHRKGIEVNVTVA
jgi:hypothetical protein